MDTAKKLLLVDDNADLRDLIQTALEAWGYEVEAFGDGMKAAQALQGGDHDAVISDINLPAITGFDIAAVAGRQSRRVPVILMSAGVQDIPPGLPVAAFLAKPFTLADLFETLAEALYGSRLPAPLAVSGGPSRPPSPRPRLARSGLTPPAASRPRSPESPAPLL